MQNIFVKGKNIIQLFWLNKGVQTDTNSYYEKEILQL